MRVWGFCVGKHHLLLSLYALIAILKSNVQNFWRTALCQEQMSIIFPFIWEILNDKHRGNVLTIFPHMSWFLHNLIRLISSDFYKNYLLLSGKRLVTLGRREILEKLFHFLPFSHYLVCYCNTLCRYFSNGCNDGCCFLKVIISVLK